MKGKRYKAHNIRWMLVLYDLLIYGLSALLLLGFYEGYDRLSALGMSQQMMLAFICIFSIRLAGNIYGQIWRYGGIQCYIRLLYTDAIAFLVYLILEWILPVEKITFARMLCLSSINLLGALAMRMMYRYAYKSDCPLFAFWSNEKGGDYVCVEPWWGTNDYPSAPREITLKPFMNFDDGTGKHFSYTLSVEKL